MFDQLCFIPVFTAHPTESKRRTVNHLLVLLHEAICQYESIAKFAARQEEILRAYERIVCLVQVLWKTDEMRLSKLTVEAEVNNGMYYYKASIFQAIPQLLNGIRKAIRKVYPGNEIKLPPVVRFGSWIGGDRDGNPFVTPEITVKTVLLHEKLTISHYLEKLDSLLEVLTHSSHLMQEDLSPPDLLSDFENEIAGFIFDKMPTDCSKEFYRRKINVMRYRLRKRLASVQHKKQKSRYRYGYAAAHEFLDDLGQLRSVLGELGDSRLVEIYISPLIDLVRTFGFHLARLDIREESGKHSLLMAEIARQWGYDSYLDLNEGEKIEFLNQRFAEPRLKEVNCHELTCEAGKNF